MKRRISFVSVVVALLLISSFISVQARNLELTATVTATPSPITFPQADFVGTPLSGTAPLTVQFTPLYVVTTGSSPILSCSWSFGDGTNQFVSGSFTSCPPITHVYTIGGNFTVNLYVQITDMVFIGTKTNYIQVAGPTATSTKTPIPCGAIIVVTSTFTPTITATATRTATATATSCGPIYQTATPGGPTFTPTRTSTPGTPTRTPTRTLTPTIGASPTRTNTSTITPTTVVGICSPVTAVIAAPFTKDGAGLFCWQSSNLGAYINSWNTTSVSINGVTITNLYVPSSSYPAKIGGYWYVSYNSNVGWGHFEAK